MERVQGVRANCVLYLDPNTNFSYFRDRADNDFSHYFRCSENLCRGRVIWRMGAENEIEQRHNHNHLADLEKISVLRFKEVLRNRAANELVSLKNIFMDEQVRHHNASLQVGGFSGAIEKMMLRARKMSTPPIPNNFEEIDEMLRNPRYIQRFSQELGPAERPFYGGILGEQRHKVLYFISPTVQHYVRTSENAIKLHMDATFSVVPRAGGAIQLFIVHFLKDHSVFPLIYCLMERKNMESYQIVLQLIRDRVLQNRGVASIMADYERALRQAISIVFPQSVLRGCWFHYSKAVYLKARQFHLIINNRNVKQGVRMAMVLPLLPERLFAEGREAVRMWLLNHAGDGAINSVEQFCSYLRRQWGELQVSVEGEEIRTNNSVESFHKSFAAMVGRAHPNIWMFVTFLKKMEHSKACDLIRLHEGVQLPNTQRPRWRLLNNRILNAQRRLELDGDVGMFLRRMSYSVEGLERNLNPNLEDIQADELQIAEAAPVMFEEGNPRPPTPQEVEEPVPAPTPPPPPAATPPPPPAATPPLPPAATPPPPRPAANGPPQIAREQLCVICLIEQITHAFIPCGHVSVCGECATEITNRRLFQCVVCRSDSFGVFRIYV